MDNINTTLSGLKIPCLFDVDLVFQEPLWQEFPQPLIGNIRLKDEAKRPFLSMHICCQLDYKIDSNNGMTLKYELNCVINTGKIMILEGTVVLRDVRRSAEP